MKDIDSTPDKNEVRHKQEDEIECFRCGICCIDYYPQVTREEIEPIARQLGISTEEFIGRYVIETQIGYLFRHTDEGCVFLTREKDSYITTCSIYDFRPEVCRSLVPSLSNRQCREGLELLKKNRR